MKYDLLFYKSRKTSYCEKALKGRLEKIKLETNRVISSVAPGQLGTVLCESLTLCNLAVIIGGFSTDGDENIVTVLSRALSTSGLTLNSTRKLNGKTECGYIIKYGRQVILSLPDDPDEIEQMLSDDLLKYLENLYS